MPHHDATQRTTFNVNTLSLYSTCLLTAVPQDAVITQVEKAESIHT